jgi:hypothetical protein
MEGDRGMGRKVRVIGLEKGEWKMCREETVGREREMWRKVREGETGMRGKGKRALEKGTIVGKVKGLLRNEGDEGKCKRALEKGWECRER